MIAISPFSLTRDGYIKLVRHPAVLPYLSHDRPPCPHFTLTPPHARRICIQGNHCSKHHVSGDQRQRLRRGSVSEESARQKDTKN